MDNSVIYESEARQQAELLSLAFERDSRRCSQALQWEKEAE
ncbi:MAG: hypothetical protein ACI4GZ_03140 [Ruminococcus sp.]